MPRRSAAWMTVVPSATSTLRPSISSVGMNGDPRRRRAQRAAAERGMLLELGTVLGDEGADGHRRRVRERADGVPQHVGRDVEQEVDVARRRVPLLELPQGLLEPARALAARGALTARLVVEEAREDG